MFTLANPEDQAILEAELKLLEKDLERDLHMLEIRKLARRHNSLRYSTMQKRVMKTLESEIAKMEPSVETMYCPNYIIKDNEIRSYLVYLLQMKDFYNSEVETRKVMIKQRKDQITSATHRLHRLINDYSRRLKKRKHRTPEFVKIDIYSRRIELAEKKLGTLRKETSDIKDDIKNMGRYRRQCLKHSDDFQNKIKEMKQEAVRHLDSAVVFYRQREDHINKAKVIQERCDTELQKALINENILHLSLAKLKKDKKFDALQKNERVDTRLQATGDMVRSGQTGLEPSVQEAERLKAVIMEASGTDDLRALKDRFQEREEQAFNMFTYLEEIESGIKDEQSAVEELKRDIKELESTMSKKSRRFQKEIKEQSEQVRDLTTEVEEIESKRDTSSTEVTDLFAKIGTIFQKSGCEDAHLKEAFDATGIHDSNVEDFMEGMECKIVELLMILEYIMMNETSAEETEDKAFRMEEEPLERSSRQDSEHLPYEVEPRTVSETDPQTLKDLETIHTFLTMDQLKDKASAVVSELVEQQTTAQDDGSERQ